MSWRLTTLDGTGRECVSASVPTRKDAERWAEKLAQEGTRIVRLNGPDGTTVEANESGNIEQTGPNPAQANEPVDRSAP